jgi:hypothetical protein
MEFARGEVAEWLIEDKAQLVLRPPHDAAPVRAQSLSLIASWWGESLRVVPVGKSFFSTKPVQLMSRRLFPTTEPLSSSQSCHPVNPVILSTKTGKM